MKETLQKVLHEGTCVTCSSVFGGQKRTYGPKNVLSVNDQCWMSGQSSSTIKMEDRAVHEIQFILNQPPENALKEFPKKLEIEFQGGFSARECDILAELESGGEKNKVVLDTVWPKDTSGIQVLDIKNKYVENKDTKVNILGMRFSEFTDFYSRVAVYYINFLL